ncbi:sterol desaturase family protein [Myroides injenensis]|uniref:sterol desaturase family protein n=1 Tax=Myroides injenensis TaxID=1183151 RepID=UPI000287BB92|nr:sterol desaturase family protein [Myroides injenensis]
MISFIEKLSVGEVLFFALTINIILYIFSIGFHRICTLLSTSKQIQEEDQHIEKRDILLSFVTIICNSFIFVIGYFLWSSGFISVSEGSTISTVFIEVIMLIIAMDFSMYIFHRLAHLPFIYRFVHGRHHEHESVNYLSLFVLHPLESLGFGFIFLLILLIYPFDVLSFSIYLFLNLLWGTIGHLNKEIITNGIFKFLKSNFLGLTLFHNQHHLYPNCNYGFYTLFWDKLFGTYKK